RDARGAQPRGDGGVVGSTPALEDLGPAGGGHVDRGEDVLERQRHPGQRRRQPLPGGHRLIDDGGRGKRLVGRHVQEGVVAVVGGRDLVQAGLGDLDRRHLLGGDPGGQRRGVGSDDLVHSLSPRICGTAKRPSTAAGASASASACVRQGAGSSGRVTFTSLSGLSVASTPATSTACTWLTWLKMASSW